jgi:hypothetical protein
MLYIIIIITGKTTPFEPSLEDSAGFYLVFSSLNLVTVILSQSKVIGLASNTLPGELLPSIYVSQIQVGPVIPPGTEFPSPPSTTRRATMEVF